MNWEQNSKRRSYTFEYDKISRLNKANFQTSYSYDKMGNIKTIQRYGVTAQGVNDKIIDNLTLDYTGNQLNYITDAGPNVSLSASADFKDYSKLTTAEYTFNKNGAMTKDLNKGIQGILYNSLNLPQEMVISHVTARAKNYYTYTATGTKLRVIHKFDPALNGKPELGSTATDASLTTSITTDYVGNKIYEAGTLKTILTDNGYIEGNTYYFYIKDHLGNNRIVANASASVVQSNQYYPFGMAFAEGTTTEQGKQEFKYNGKELDRSHELNQYDYSARFYDPGYNRFTTMDPHMENYYSWSPYVYCLNNPMKYIDPTGMDTARVYTETVDGGHAWISVGKGKDMVMYSYGPFTNNYTGSSSHKVTASGIVVKYTGNEAVKYLDDKIRETKDVSVATITDVDDSKVQEIIEGYVREGTVNQTLVLDKLGEDKQIIGTQRHINVNNTYGTYNILTNNCTTFVSDVLNASGSKVLEKSYYNKIGERKALETYTTPSGLRNALNSNPIGLGKTRK